jgi:hypothetical protein
MRLAPAFSSVTTTGRERVARSPHRPARERDERQDAPSRPARRRRRLRRDRDRGGVAMMDASSDPFGWLCDDPDDRGARVDRDARAHDLTFALGLSPLPTAAPFPAPLGLGSLASSLDADDDDGDDDDDAWRAIARSLLLEDATRLCRGARTREATGSSSSSTRRASPRRRRSEASTPASSAWR